MSIPHIKNSTHSKATSFAISDKIRCFLVIVFCLIAIFQSGLRNIDNLPTGNDTKNYQYIYEKTSKLEWSDLWSSFIFVGSEYSERDLGYPLFIKITQAVWTDFTFFMFLTAILFIVPFGLLISRYVKSSFGVILSYLIYFALFTNIVNSFMRQAVVLGIFLFALRYVIEKSWKKYYAMLLVAFTIHNSAIVAVPFYLLPKLKQKRGWTLLALSLLPVLIYFTNSFLPYLLGGTVYANYIDAETVSPINYALFVVGVSVFTFFTYKKMGNVPNFDILIGGVIGSLVLMPIVFLGNTMLRVSYYYVLLLIPLIPVLIDNVKMKKPIRLVVYAFSISFFLYFIFRR